MFKCFKDTSVDFCYPGCKSTDTPYPNINLVLGDNGSGKSSLLQGIALSILGSVLTNQGYRPRGLIKEPEREHINAFLKTALTSGETIEEFVMHVIRRGTEQVLTSQSAPPESLWDAQSSDFFLCGYGAGRRAAPRENYDPKARDDKRGRRYQRVASLFDEEFHLTSVSGWFLEGWGHSDSATHPRWKEVRLLLKSLLSGTGVSAPIAAILDDLYFTLEETNLDLPFTLLSDGYRAYLSWICDLLRHLIDVAPENTKLTDIRGIVLVDEIDLHLHPSWQRRILPQLSKCLPALQFIVTSHSPILAGSLPWKNVWIAGIAEDGAAQMMRSDKDYYGKSVDEILTGSYFELQTTLSPHLAAEREAKRNKMNELARAVLTDGDENAAKAYLEALRES